MLRYSKLFINSVLLLTIPSSALYPEGHSSYPVQVQQVSFEEKTMSSLGEEMGLTAREMGRLKQVGKLQETLDNAFEHLINRPGYEVLKAAINEEKHVKFIRTYFDKPAKELQKSVKSFEKLIAEHKDKIANPSKYFKPKN